MILFISICLEHLLTFNCVSGKPACLQWTSWQNIA